ncbi:methyltransferase domain-containing protein [Micromonospora aurantiaca]|uniref:SAM-dependent methyltransferase n=1 Tax=Micromonospora aurantiaca (nom. illeg.) TaxID=47850 RepID=UPI000F40DB67|nr:methyltransferase domain-containing protein [Micromonospora aurantiaca]RNH98195.1 methyltransferase domain-containing protein [Micromonospora aurantiaca]
MTDRTNKDLLTHASFPRASRYNPEWLTNSVSGGANSLWMAEWLSDVVDFRPGMRVLDLGCGRGASSIFLAREFGVQVWAADLWFGADDRQQRVREAGLDDQVFPVHCDARALPFARDFFDAVVSIDSYVYYGTDDLYLSYLLRLLKPGGTLGIAGAGLVQEIDGAVPEHLRNWWEPNLACLHSAQWWRRHWERTGLVEVTSADTMPDGWQRWLDWQHAVAPHNTPEIEALKADEGRYLGYVRATARRGDHPLDDPITVIPTEYVSVPMLREAG